ncbi:MAG: GTP-binding protein EngB [Candidatus Bathyarchaeota archaeon]|jgi:GTP-binding protein EngB required for normal cell division
MSERLLVFTGRPNSGKSTIIRLMTGIKTRSGKRPGTTRRILTYQVGKHLSLVDMPGYGRISGAPKRQEGRIKDEIIDFIETRGRDIAVAVHVLDVSTFREVSRRLERKGFIPIDLEMIQFITENTQDALVIAANKIDKIRGDPQPLLNETFESIVGMIPPGTEIAMYPVSGRTGEGVGELKAAVVRKLVEKGLRAPFRM